MQEELVNTNTPEQTVEEPIPENVMDELAPEIQVAGQEAVLPEEQPSEEWMNIRKRLDAIEQTAARSAGAENAYFTGDFNSIVSAIQGEDKKEAIKALEAVAYRTDFSVEQKAAAMLQIADYNRSNTEDAEVADTAASVARGYVRQSLNEDGSVAGNAAVVNAFRNGESAKAANIEMTLENTDDLSAFRAAYKKGGIKLGTQVLMARMNENADILSTATVSGFVPGVTEGRTQALYAKLASQGFPEIRKVLDKYTAIGGATLLRGEVDFEIMEVVKKLPEERQAKLAEALLREVKSNDQYGTMAHIYADVADKLFRRVGNPEMGKTTVGEVFNAIGEGGGNVIQKILSTPAAEMHERYIRTPGFATLDWLPLLGAAKSVSVNAMRRIKPMLSNTLHFTGLTRPKAATRTAMAAAQSDDAAKALGYASREDALLRMRPMERQFYESSDIAYNVQEQVLTDAAYRKRVFDEMFAVSSGPSNIVDVATLRSGLMSEMAGARIVPHTAYTSIDVEDGMFVVRGMFGESAELGYKTQDDAISTARKFWGKEADIKPVLRRRVSGQVIHPEDANYKTLVADAKANPEEYDWWARVDTKREPFSIESEVIGQTKANPFVRALGGDNPVANNMTGGLAQLVPNEVLAKSIFAAGNSRFAVESFRKLNDLSRLGMDERKALSAILYRQNKEPDNVLLTSAQLREAGLSSVEGQAAYYNTRLLLDNTHKYADYQLANGLAKDGYKDILGPDGARLGFGKPADAGALATGKNYNVRVIDEGAEDVLPLSGAQVADMAKGDYTLYTSRIKEFVKRTSDDVDLEVTHFLVNNKVKATQVADVPPSGVLPYRSGYVPDVRTGRIAIYGMSENEGRHIIGFADSITDADKAIATLKATPKMLQKFPNGIDKEIFKGVSNEYSAVGSRETFENLNGLVFGKKGDEIKNFSGVDGSATQLDPLEAVNYMLSTLATQYTKGKHIDYLENLAESFAKKWDLKRPNVGVVRSVEDLKPASELLGDKLVARNKLQGFLKHLEAQRIAPDWVDELSGKAWKAIADVAAKKQIRWIEKLAIARAQNPVNVLQLITKFNYFSKIRTAPHKHLIQNLASGLINVAHPVSMAKGLAQRGAFTTALDLLDSKTLSAAEIDKAIANLAKSFGTTKAEFSELLKAAREGGIINAADNNVLFRNSLETQAQLLELQSINRHNVRGDKGGLVNEAWQVLNKTLSEVGDVAGEREAMITTFLTQYNVLKGQKGFNIASRASKEMLVGKTMVLSGNMVHEGSLAFQKGALRAAFQFNAYSTKMLWNALMPNALGGASILSKQDALGMAVTQVFMFGADAVVGARYAADTLMNAWANDGSISPEEQQRRNMYLVNSGVQGAVQKGFIGMYLNGLMKSYMEAWNPSDDETGKIYADLNFTNFLSALGGGDMIFTTISNAIKGLTDAGGLIQTVGGPEGWWAGSKDAATALMTTGLGFSAKTPSNIMDSIMSVARITGAAYRGEATAWDVNRAARRAVLENTVASSRPFISVLMSERYGEEVANGKPRNKAFEAGLYGNLKMYFGLQTIQETEAYKLNEELRKLRQNNMAGSKGYKALMRKDADAYVAGLIKDLSYLASSKDEKAESLRDAVMERHGRQLAVELASMKTYDALEYEQAINDSLTATFEKQPIEAKVLMDALGIMQQKPESYADFNYIKGVLGKSDLVREDMDTLDSFIEYMNTFVKDQFGDVEE